jgi:diguanylate cyclase (GGDEF)-like protein
LSIGPSDVFLIAAFIALLCLGALMSLARSRLPGVRLALAANALAFVSTTVLWAMLRWDWAATPALLAGNGVIVVAVLLLAVALCRLTDRPVPVLVLAIGTPIFALVYLAELIVWPSITARVVIVSAAHVVLVATIIRVVWPIPRSEHAGYGRWFTIVVLILSGALQGTRAVIYASGAEQVGTLGDHQPWNTAFLGLNALALAALLLGVVLIGNDRLVAERSLEADTDFLTGVLTTRGWHRALDALRATTGTGMTILLADLDHFKEINDRHGHAAGDAVLRHFVATLRRAAGPEPVIGRVGGEEFALTFVASYPERVRQIGESALCLLHNDPPTFDGITIPVSYSGGIACWSADEPLELAMRRADAAMYDAKSAGRALIVVADGDALPG